jgi:hypothetical protein
MSEPAGSKHAGLLDAGLLAGRPVGHLMSDRS